MEVLIRYNNKAIGDNDRWRLLIEGKEFVCAHVQISCQSETCMQPIIEGGKPINKYHIRAYNFNEIIFQFGKDNKLIVLLV
jgi:hypothetical protein